MVYMEPVCEEHAQYPVPASVTYKHPPHLDSVHVSAKKAGSSVDCVISLYLCPTIR
uniref:Uncharacterized protein n=1 Tax=Anguilla anguilla TaxID=7936 RepID=A0A0E9SZ15_ANGAN